LLWLWDRIVELYRWWRWRLLSRKHERLGYREFCTLREPWLRKGDVVQVIDEQHHYDYQVKVCGAVSRPDGMTSVWCVPILKE